MEWIQIYWHYKELCWQVGLERNGFPERQGMYKQSVLLAAVAPGLNGFFPNLPLSLKKDSVLIFIESVCPSTLLSPLEKSLFPREIRAIKLCVKPSYAENFEDFSSSGSSGPTEQDWTDPHLPGIAIHSSCLPHSHDHIVVLSLCNPGAIVNMSRFL